MNGYGAVGDARKRMQPEDAAQHARNRETTRREAAAEARVEELKRERDELRTVVDAVQAMATEWGLGHDEYSAEDFAEAIRDSGAWRFARDLRAALSAEGSTA